MSIPRDHGGGLDAAIVRYGGARANWQDLSTGINPVPYPVRNLSQEVWTDLPDQRAMDRLLKAARSFWAVPNGAAIIAAPGASALIARIPAVLPPGRVSIPAPTYNEHAAAFDTHGWPRADGTADVLVAVHPNNPDGKLWSKGEVTAPVVIIDESFCDVSSEVSLMELATRPGTLILKSFGKFWGLAGLRLGFAIGDPSLVDRLSTELGPWPVSGPALQIGASALADRDWAESTRQRLAGDADRLDALMAKHGHLVGGTSLFRLYDVGSAAHWQERLASHCIWSRIFPYSAGWLRLGLPAPDRWDQLEEAL